MNQYRPNESQYQNEQKNNHGNFFKNLTKGLLIAGIMSTPFLLNKCNTQPETQIINGPKGYELVEFNIPLKYQSTHVSEIHLGDDTTKMKRTYNPEEGTITYEGPIKYRISNPRSPDPEDAKLTERMSEATKPGSVTLKKSIDDHL